MPKKVTPQDYIKRCKQNGYDLPIQDYMGTNKKIKHKCSKSHIYLQTPHQHLRGNGCPICKGTPKKTTEQYIDECKEKGLDLPIEDYATNETKIKHKCSKGHIYLQSPHHHLRGQGCPKCKDTKKKPQDYYNECKEKVLDLPIEDYINATTKIKHKCSICNYEYMQTPSSHLNGSSCPKCNGTLKKTYNKYLKECIDRGLDKPIEKYIDRKTKIKHKCRKGHVYLQTPNNHLYGNGCPICGIAKSKPLKSSEQYVRECKEKGLDLPIEDYVNAETKIKFKCQKGHIYEQRASSHLEGYGCPICKESHGEKFIRDYLDTNNILYESQKTFKDLKDRKQLSYDFYLPKQKILIEYQGKQHYEPSTHFGGIEHLELQQKHDKLKKEYAKKNGYRLLELHYSLDTQDKVNKYLSRRIK